MTLIDGAMQIAKISEDEQHVFGWASVVQDAEGLIVDSHGDVIEPEELERAAYDYVLHARAGGERHQGDANCRLIESFVMTAEKAEAMGVEAKHVGWWIGMHVDDPAAFAKVKSREYAMFSIEGTAVAEDVAYDEPAHVPAPAAKAVEPNVVNVTPEFIVPPQAPPQINFYPPTVRKEVIRDEAGRIIAVEEHQIAQ